MRRQRFTPLIYRGSVRELHCSLYRGISACPTRNSLTLICGLRLPACRMLDTTISSQSRQETFMSPKIPSLEKVVEYFLNPKFYIKLLTSTLLATITICIFFNYSTITETYIPNAIKFIVTPTRESVDVLFIALIIIFFCKNHLALSIQNLFSKLTSKYFMILLAGLALIGASAALHSFIYELVQGKR